MSSAVVSSRCTDHRDGIDPEGATHGASLGPQTNSPDYARGTHLNDDVHKQGSLDCDQYVGTHTVGPSPMSACSSASSWASSHGSPSATSSNALGPAAAAAVATATNGSSVATDQARVVAAPYGLVRMQHEDPTHEHKQRPKSIANIAFSAALQV